MVCVDNMNSLFSHCFCCCPFQIKYWFSKYKKNSINKNRNIYKLEHAVFIYNALLFFVREYISAIHRQTEFIKWCIVIHICQRLWEEMHFDEKTIRLYQVAILASSVDIAFCLFGRYHLTWVHVTTYRYTMKISAR